MQEPKTLEIGPSRSPGPVSLPLADLRESKTNPRRSWESAGLKELADSMLAHGVLEPLLVRPVNGDLAPGPAKATDKQIDGLRYEGKFEIVVGARRFRAAKLAKLETIPVIVQVLTDTEAMEIQIIENLQREDVQPLDEGLGYRALLDLWEKEPAEPESQKEKGKGQKSQVEMLAEKIGKSASYVYQRLKLADLTKPAQQALAAGKMSAGHAVQIARLQPEAQTTAVKMIEHNAKSLHPMTVRELGNWIQMEIHRNLDKAPWKKDDASLLPAAGACTVCPKRAGTNPQAFPDLGPQTCTDINCFRAKMAAFVKLSLDAHPGALHIASSGFYEIEYSDREAAKKSGVICKAQYEGDTGWKPSSEGACKFTKDAVIIVGETSILGRHSLVCAEPKCPVHGTRSSSRGRVPASPGVMNEERKRQVEALWQRREKLAVRLALHAALRKKQEKLTTMPIEALRFAVEAAYHNAQVYQDAAEHFAKTWAVKAQGHYPFEKLIAGAGEYTLLRLLLDLPLVQDVAEKFSDGKEIALAAKAYGLPMEKITAEIHKEWAEKKRISYAKRDARLAAERAKVEGKKPAPNKEGPASLLTGRAVKPGADIGRAVHAIHTGELCRYCGCTESTPCLTDGEPCGWLVKPKKRGKNYIAGVCSAPKCALAFQKDKRSEKRGGLQTNAKKPATNKVRKTRKPKAQKRGKKR
jgi:ParB family chromosome partitioning protein